MSKSKRGAKTSARTCPANESGGSPNCQGSGCTTTSDASSGPCASTTDHPGCSTATTTDSTSGACADTTTASSPRAAAAASTTSSSASGKSPGEVSPNAMTVSCHVAGVQWVFQHEDPELLSHLVTIVMASMSAPPINVTCHLLWQVPLKSPHWSPMESSFTKAILIALLISVNQMPPTLILRVMIRDNL